MKKKSKTYSLNDSEKRNIESRQELIKQYQYLIHLVNNDIVGYIKYGVYPRIGVEEKENYTLSPDLAFIEIMKENKIGDADENTGK